MKKISFFILMGTFMYSCSPKTTMVSQFMKDGDKNKDGFLSQREYVDYMMGDGSDITKAEAEGSFTLADTNGDGKLSKAEVKAVMEGMMVK